MARCSSIFGSGDSWGYWSVSTPRCVSRFVSRVAGKRNPVLPSWIVNRSKRWKRGERGLNGAKKMSGRKRHIWVDTMGLLLKVKVHAADISDSVGGRSCWRRWEGLSVYVALMG